MVIRTSGPPIAATDPGRQADAGFTWFYDKPLPYSLTPSAEKILALDDPEAEAEADLW